MKQTDEKWSSIISAVGESHTKLFALLAIAIFFAFGATVAVGMTEITQVLVIGMILLFFIIIVATTYLKKKKSNVNGRSDSITSITELENRASYLENICSAIRTAKEEVLFTTKTMAHPGEDERQRSINLEAATFSAKKKNRHRGVVSASPQALAGAIQLKKDAPNVELRFNSKNLELRDLSYFVVDRKSALLGIGRGETKEAYKIDSLAVSELIRQDFQELWENSTTFSDFILKTFDDCVDEVGLPTACDLLQCKSRDELIAWLAELPEPSESFLDGQFGQPKAQTIFYDNVRICGVLKQQLESRQLNQSSIESLRKCISEGQPIDYKNSAGAFLYLYFAANYLKVRYALSRGCSLPEYSNVFRVLDMGCGSGASTLAVLDWLRIDRGFQGQIEIVAVDQDSSQIELLKLCLPEQPSVAIDICCAEMQSFLESDNRNYDLALDGNFLCEVATEERLDIVERLAGRLQPNGLIVVVERSQSGVFSDLSRAYNIGLYSQEAIGPIDVPVRYLPQEFLLPIEPKSTFTVSYACYGPEI